MTGKNKIKQTKRTFKITLFLTLLAAVGAAVAVLGFDPHATKAAPNSTLYFSEVGVPATPVTTKSVNVNGDFSLDVAINPGSNQVSGAELHVTYDHTKFGLTSIDVPSAPANCAATPKFSNILTSAVIDNANGTASIVVGVCTATPAVTIPTSTVATFNFHAIAATSALPIAFDNATFATAVGEGGDVLTSKTGVNVTVTAGSGGTPPTLTSVTPVPTPTKDTTPSYTFNSSVVGTVSYPDPSCVGDLTTTIVGDNTLTFNAMADGTYTCPITVTETATPANFNTIITSFTVDTSAPVVTELTPVTTPTNDTTPDYTFNTTEAGTVSYGGDCGSTTGGAITSGSKTVTFATLSAGVHSNCTVTVTDSATNVSNVLPVTAFTIDTTAPVVAQASPVASPTAAPVDYSFSSTEVGAITYGGSCSSSTTNAIVGTNDIIFNVGSGTYSNCTIRVTDSATNVSNVLAVNTFTVDVNAPVLSALSPSGTLAIGTTQTTVSLTTNENASCQYAASSGVAYGNSSATAFTTGQGTMSHSFNATGLLSGVPYSYWVRCQDSLGNANTSDTLISFSVGTPAVAVTSPSGGEAWNVGETHSVTWTAVGASNVKLYITDSNIVGSGNVDYITPDGGSVSASSGSYSWVVGTPHAILPGSNYRIRIDAVDSNGNVLTNGSGAEIRAFSANVFSVSQAAVVSNNNDSSSHKDDKKETPSRTVTNSKKTAVRGDILTQRGKKFSKNTIVQLYFAKPGGGYYPPQSVKTSSTGSFVVTYKVNKPKGKYGWYVFDTKTSKKSKIVYYSVK